MVPFETGFSLEELTQHIAEFTHDAIVVAEAEPFDDPGPRIVYVNPAFTVMTGYTADEVLGKTPRLLQGKDTSRQTKHQIRDAMARWQSVRAELLNYRKDGSTFWVELSIVPVADAKGWHRYWVAVQRDITERRQLDQKRQLQERIMQALDDGILVADATRPGMPIEYVNERAERITGYPRAEFIGRNCRFLQGPGTDPAAVTRLREGIALARTTTTEILNYRKDGSTFLNLVTLSPMFDEQGKLIKFIGVQRDVTALHEREQQMVIAQRVKAVGELAGGIAHDFNNLLTSIIGATDLLAERVRGDSELTLLAETIRSAAQRGGSQVRRLMSLTRTPLLNRSPVDLHAVVLQMRQLLSRSLRESIHLEINMAPDARWVDAESVQLESALLNLVINAQDAMPQGGTITISSSALVDDKQPWVCLSVVDSGAGMSEETLQRIFDPFFTTKEVGRGAGLGLPMVHAFVTQMGGKIQVSSGVGKGTNFTLWLLPATAPKDAAVLAPAGNGLANLVPRQVSKVVLLVEDDTVVRITARAMLERLGHQVIEAENADRALQVLQTDQPVDLLFTDLLMPGGMNGRDLCQFATALRPGLMRLQTSGWADSTLDAEHQTEVHFIAKPYTLQELANALHSVLSDGPLNKRV